MDSQTKKEIIAEISSTATKTIEQAVRDSLKRALPQEFCDKTTNETIKRIKSSTIPEFKVQAIRFVTKRTTVFSKKSMMLSIPWTGRCIKVIFYIDEGLVAIRGFEFANSVSELIRNDLLFAGFAINNEKSDFNPKAKGKWPGTVINTFTVPREKITKLLVNITKYLNQQFLIPKRFLKVQRY